MAAPKSVAYHSKVFFRICEGFTGRFGVWPETGRHHFSQNFTGETSHVLQVHWLGRSSPPGYHRVARQALPHAAAIVSAPLLCELVENRECVLFIFLSLFSAQYHTYYGYQICLIYYIEFYISFIKMRMTL